MTKTQMIEMLVDYTIELEEAKRDGDDAYAMEIEAMMEEPYGELQERYGMTWYDIMTAVESY